MVVKQTGISFYEQICEFRQDILDLELLYSKLMIKNVTKQ